MLGGKWFTNMYRELDREIIYFKRQMTNLRINKSKISENLLKEILFKSILYRLLKKVETFLRRDSQPQLAVQVPELFEEEEGEQ